MPHARSHVTSLLLGLVLVASAESWALAVGWSDNFDDMSVTDGNPVTWSRYPDNFPFFQGTYDVSTGDYAMSNPGNSNDNDQLVTWVDNASFTNLYMRAQGIVLPGTLPEETGGNLALLARLDVDTVSAYVLYVDAGANLGLQISLGGALDDLAPSVDLAFDATSDVIIELNIVGNTLNGFAWQPGQPKPETPQITATDNTFPSGKAGIAFDEDDDNTIGVFRFAAAQDTPFVDAPPGDFDGDLDVDGDDYLKWQRDLGDAPTLAQWQTNYGSGAAVAAAAGVPEPAGLTLELAAAIAAGTARRRLHLGK